MAHMVKNPPTMRETWVWYPGLGRSPGGGHGNPLQYSCLENCHEQRSLEGFSLGVAQSQTQLSVHTHMGNTYTHTCKHILRDSTTHRVITLLISVY